MWWIIGMIATWTVAAVILSYWMGKAISHTDLEERAAELRRDERERTAPEQPPGRV